MGLKSFFKKFERAVLRPIFKAAPAIATTFIPGLGISARIALGAAAQAGSNAVQGGNRRSILGNAIKGGLIGAAAGLRPGAAAANAQGVPVRHLGANQGYAGQAAILNTNAGQYFIPRQSTGFALAPNGKMVPLASVPREGVLTHAGPMASSMTGAPNIRDFLPDVAPAAAGLIPTIAKHMLKQVVAGRGAGEAPQEMDEEEWLDMPSERVHHPHGVPLHRSKEEQPAAEHHLRKSHSVDKGDIAAAIAKLLKPNLFEQMEHKRRVITDSDNVTPTLKPYKTGGKVPPLHKGYINFGDTEGDADDIETAIPAGSYVWNATDLSLLGNGSSDNGAKKVAHFEQEKLKSNVMPYDWDSHNVNYLADGGSAPKHKYMPVKLSNKEYVMCPEAVSAIGNGDNKKGAAIIDKARRNLRKQKGVKDILPPKAKHIEFYIEKGSK